MNPKVTPHQRKSQPMFKAELITFVEVKYMTTIAERKGEGHFTPEEPPVAPHFTKASPYKSPLYLYLLPLSPPLLLFSPFLTALQSH